MLLLFLEPIGQPRYIGGVKEGHISSSTDIERRITRRPCYFSPRRNRGEKEAGRNPYHTEEEHRP